MRYATRNRPILKWAGNKISIVDHINAQFPEHKSKRLIEPFVGSGAVFLNSDFEQYLLADSNQDIINLYQCLKLDGEGFIAYAKQYFHEKYNTKLAFYELRERFNHCAFTEERAALFFYLNRHCYNGLCRYNSKGLFNVPFGRYGKPYFPTQEMRFFHDKAQRAEFICADYKETLKQAKKADVCYCDPPYVPLSDTANFTHYSVNDFDLQEQENLAQLLNQVAKRGTTVVISNHDTRFTRKIYRGAKIKKLAVTRTISCKSREPAKELLALF